MVCRREWLLSSFFILQMFTERLFRPKGGVACTRVGEQVYPDEAPTQCVPFT